MKKKNSSVKLNTLTPIMNRKIGQSLTMSFSEAIKKVIEGKKITRIAWGNEDFCLIRNEWLTVYTKKEFHTWIINEGDMFAEDWIII